MRLRWSVVVRVKLESSAGVRTISWWPADMYRCGWSEGEIHCTQYASARGAGEGGYYSRGRRGNIEISVAWAAAEFGPRVASCMWRSGAFSYPHSFKRLRVLWHFCVSVWEIHWESVSVSMSAREVTLSGGSPWGFRMHGGHDLHQPLRISRVSRYFILVFFFPIPPASFRMIK